MLLIFIDFDANCMDFISFFGICVCCFVDFCSVFCGFFVFFVFFDVVDRLHIYGIPDRPTWRPGPCSCEVGSA